MPSATAFLIAGVLLAVTLSLAAWVRQRLPRSPLRSVDEFHETLRALAPREPHR